MTGLTASRTLTWSVWRAAKAFLVRTRIPLLFPGVLFGLLIGVFKLYPESVGWSASAVYRLLPYLLLGISFLLGVAFAQSRIALISLLVGVILFLVNYTVFVREEAARGAVVVLLGAIYAPALSLVFYFLGERGLFNLHGFVRLMIVFSALAFIVLLVGIRPLHRTMGSVDGRLMESTAGWLTIPLGGVVVFLLCVPFLCIPRAHESPCLGPLLAEALCFVLAGLNFRSSAWGPHQQQTVLMGFMSGGAVVLSWAVLETVWRNAYIDELTGLPGRRSLKMHCLRLAGDYALAMVDIDHFKKINDRYGHQAGDQVLRYVASQLQADRTGRTYRYGGEEFVVVCENGEYRDVVVAMDTLRKAIEDRVFVVRGKGRPRKKPDAPPAASRGPRKKVTVTVSIGVARRNERYPTPRDVIAAADKLLYRAKRAGRNRVKAAR